MSKLLIEMEMPTRCGACKCRHVEFDIDRVAVFCEIKDNEYVEDPDSRPSWCPIVGVLPETHGRLIDADELKTHVRNVVKEIVDNSPTIVPAERKDDGKTAD